MTHFILIFSVYNFNIKTNLGELIRDRELIVDCDFFLNILSNIKFLLLIHFFIMSSFTSGISA